jgi:hypothetical protein
LDRFGEDGIAVAYVDGSALLMWILPRQTALAPLLPHGEKGIRLPRFLSFKFDALIVAVGFHAFPRLQVGSKPSAAGVDQIAPLQERASQLANEDSEIGRCLLLPLAEWPLWSGNGGMLPFRLVLPVYSAAPVHSRGGGQRQKQT